MKAFIGGGSVLLLLLICSRSFASTLSESPVFNGVYTTWGNAATYIKFKEVARVPLFSQPSLVEGELRYSEWTRQSPEMTLGNWPHRFRVQVKSLTPSGKLFLSSTFVAAHDPGYIENVAPVSFRAIDMEVNEGTCYGDGIRFFPSKKSTSEAGFDLFSDIEPVSARVYRGAEALRWLDERKKIVNKTANSALNTAREYLSDSSVGAGLHIHPQNDFGVLSFGNEFLFVFPRKDKSLTHVELWREDRFASLQSVLFRPEGMYAVVMGHDPDEDDYCWGPVRTYKVSDGGVQRGVVEKAFGVEWRSEGRNN